MKTQAEINKRRNVIACLLMTTSREWTEDNLSIALATYFSDRSDRPDDDKVDEELGWSPWVMKMVDEMLDRIMDAVERPRRSDVTPSESSLHTARVSCKLMLGLVPEDAPAAVRADIETMVRNIAVEGDARMAQWRAIGERLAEAQKVAAS